MTNHNLQKPLEPFPPLLDHSIVKLVEVHFSRQRGDCDARALPLEYVAEVLKVAVAAADGAVAQFEGGDVCVEGYEVGGIARVWC